MVFESLIIFAKYLLISFGYLAAFFIGIVSSSTLFIPFPMDAIIFFAARLGLWPLAVGILAGIGAGIGEITGYLVGAGGRFVITEKKGKVPKFIKTLTLAFKKYGFYAIVVASFIPFAFDMVGILAGTGKYEIKKFLIATILGKVAKYLLIAYAGQWIVGWIGV